MNLNIKTTKNIYFSILAILFVLIIFSPYLIKEGISIFSEEIIEVISLTILLAISIVVYAFYQKELEKHEKKLNEALNYIGSINVQIGQIKSVFDDVPKYPENKNDLKAVFKELADKVLGILNVDWVLFRIIDISTGQTASEYVGSRGNSVLLKYEIGNKDLLDNKELNDYLVVQSRQKNLKIRAYCIMPIKSINSNQKMVIKTIVNDLAMFYLVFASFYYNKNNKNLEK